MKHVWLVVLAVVALLVACGGSSSSSVNTTPSTDADALRDQVVAAMNDLESYRVEMDFGEGEPLIIEYVKPNSYRTLFVANDNQTGERALGELLHVGDSIYARNCDADGSDCQAWNRTPRGQVIVGAASPSTFPQWPLVAFEMAKDVTVSARGGDLLFVGAVNTTRAVLESTRRLLDREGRTDFGRECASSSNADQINGGGASRTPAPVTRQEACRDTTYEDMLAEESDNIAFLDENPATIEAAVDKDTHLVSRIEITLPSRESDQEAAVFVMTYSNYDDVTIEAPE